MVMASSKFACGADIELDRREVVSLYWEYRESMRILSNECARFLVK